MAPHTDDANRFQGGQLTVLVSASTDPESCVDTLRASGVHSTIERFDFADDEPLVQAAIPIDRKPSTADIEAATLTVVQILDRSEISHEVRGTGFQTAS
jgi:hypothetical protein